MSRKSRVPLPRTPAEMTQRVCNMLEPHAALDVTIITPKSTLDTDLNMDVLDVVEFMMDCEKAFRIKISDIDVEGVTTVKHASDMMFKKVSGLASFISV